jgi:hypothetical protein
MQVTSQEECACGRGEPGDPGREQPPLPAREARLDKTRITADSGVGDFGIRTVQSVVALLVNRTRGKYQPVEIVVVPGEKQA